MSVTESLPFLPVAAYACDRQGQITSFNPLAQKLWGRSPRLHCNEQLYCGCFQMLQPDGSPLPPHESAMAQVLRSGIACTDKEVIFKREDGQIVFALLNASPLSCPSGASEGAIGVLTEISPLQKIIKRQEKDIAEFQKTEMFIHEANEQEQHLAMHFLHEDIGQRLTGIALLAGVLNKTLAKESHPLAKRADEISKLTGGCIAIASDLAKGFYPLNIEVDGLMVALEYLIQRTESHFKISCKLLRSDSCQVDQKNSIHLYRIVQIAILGAIHNYGARNITIAFNESGGTSSAEIRHDKNSLKQKVDCGVEFYLLNSRSRLIGASVEIVDAAERQVLLTWSL